MTTMRQAHGFDDDPTGRSYAERLQMCADAIERRDLRALERFSPAEIDDVLTATGQSDPMLVEHIRVVQEVGSVFLHLGVGNVTAEDDAEFLEATLRTVFPELAPDDRQEM
jgi:hypothetical protein